MKKLALVLASAMLFSTAAIGFAQDNTTAPATGGTEQGAPAGETHKHHDHDKMHKHRDHDKTMHKDHHRREKHEDQGGAAPQGQ